MSATDFSPLINELAQADQLRHRRIIDGPPDASMIVDGTRVLAFASNDYLGLANHPTVVAAAMRALKAGLISTASEDGGDGGAGSSMGEISLTMILRPPCSWIVDSRMSALGMMNPGFAGSGGGGVPSGRSPRTWAVVASGGGAACSSPAWPSDEQHAMAREMK